MLAACSQLESPVDTPKVEDGALVPVSLKLDVVPVDAGLTTSKADIFYEPEDPAFTADDAVRTVLLLQFDGDGPDAELIGQQQYYDHWPLDPTQDDGFSLVARSTPQTVVVVANTFGYLSLTDHTTLGNFLENENYREINTLDGLWRKVESGGDTHHYLQMGGHHTFPSVTSSTSMSMSLRRNCAKVVVNLTNNAYDKTGDNKVTIDHVQLCAVNAKNYYVADFSAAAGDLFDFEDPFTNVRPYRFDVQPQAFTHNDGTVQTLTYFLPVNLRGEGANTDPSASQKTKNLGAPLGATFLKIYARYGDEDKPIVYSYYLGGDLINDFNLKPNHKYTYNISVSGKGVAASDYRIEDLNHTVFQVDANCYMLQPSPLAGGSLTYSIPVRRAAVFWNPMNINNGYYGASGGDDEVLTLTESTPWTAVLVWNEIHKADGTLAGAQELLPGSTDVGGEIQVSGKGFDPDYVGDAIDGHNPYIRVRVENGMKGNALVAIRNSMGIILWSWHLWVTEYNPDVEMTPVDGTYVYPVPGGSVHRYNNTYWGAGTPYQKAFMMDRNLGAIAEVGYGRGVGVNDSYGMYYEWGRKDPFFSRAKWTTPVKFMEGADNVTYSIHHPTTWIDKDGNYKYWTAPGRTALSDREADWNDPVVLNGVGKSGGVCEPGKSVYDPCPPGWRVVLEPRLYNGLSLATGDNRTREYTSLYGSADLIYPAGYAMRATKGTVFYPIQDVFYTALGIQRNDISCCYQYAKSGNHIRIAESGFGNSGDGGAGSPGGAGPVRCIRMQ